jgi:hypothetical protein
MLNATRRSKSVSAPRRAPFSGEPVILYSEIESGFDVRKVEVYRMAGMTTLTGRGRREGPCSARS